MMGRRSLTLFTIFALLGAPALAHAGGFEYAAPGTRALGRGGAFMARADDPMALGYNPAALAFLPGYQLMLGSHLAFYDACVDRSGTYAVDSFLESRFGYTDTNDPSNWVNTEMPQVCRGGYPGPSPQLVFTARLLPELGIGFGILAPAGVGNGTWGNDDGTVEVNGMSLPTPTRYALTHQDLLLFHPTVGIGVSPVEWLSLGVSFQWGMAIVGFTNHTSAGMGTEDPAEDVRTVLHAEDWFIPAVIVSAHFVPIDALDIVISARLSDGIDGGGSLTLTTGWFGSNDPLATTSFAPETTVVDGVRLQAGQPWQFGLAVRYADRRERRYRDPDQAARVTGRVEDQMQNENWDIELDVVYQHNGQVRDFIVTPPAGTAAAVCEGPRDDNGACARRFTANLPGTLPIAHGWQDQVSVRLGADWNILPGQLAVRAGAHWESSGINSTYQIQDFIPGMRLGLHAGMTFRIDRFDLSIAYAHIFQFTETVTDGDHRMVSATGSVDQCTEPSNGIPPEMYDPNNPVTSRGCYPQGFGSVVNNGTYTGQFNILSLQASYHFQ